MKGLLHKKLLPALATGLALAITSPVQAIQFEHVMMIGTQGTGEGQFKYVEDFDFSADGHLLATDAAHAWVQVFDAATGEFISRFAGKGDDDEHLEKPEGISVTPDGRIFVADYTTGDVKIYDRNYNWLQTFSEYGSEPGQNIKSEFTDIRNGLYYMPEAGNHRISVWDLEGNFQFTFGSPGTGPGQLNNPEASKFNSKGELIVADLKNDRMQVFTDKGVHLRVFSSSGSEPGQLSKPAGVGIDSADNIFVGEIGNNRVSVFDKDGNFLGAYGQSGDGIGEFGNIHGVIVDKKTGWVYVADTANNRIQVFKIKS